MQYFNDFLRFIPTNSLNFLLCGFLWLLIVSFFYLKSNTSHRLLFNGLFFLGFVLFGIGFSLIDPFLNEWDEQFHALVAKNLAENPFVPVLIKNSPVDLDYSIWSNAHIWMHKQPLFMWQMALSVKIFGTSLFAARFPSVLLHAVTAVLLIAIARRFLSNPLSLLAGLLFGLSGYYNDFTSGAIGMDHNDVAFVFYVTLSFWAWLKYRENNRSVKWQVIIGIAAGCAIMCKWLVGLIVFSGWGIVILLEEWKNWQEWKNLLRSFIATCVVFLPWQIYCYLRFPKEYLHEMRYNSRHLTEAVELHNHDYFFYWQNMKQAFGGGELIRWIILTGLILFVVNAFKNKEKWKLFFPIVFLIVYGFFTIVPTKLPGYVTIVGPLGFLFLLFVFQQLFTQTPLKKQKIPGWMVVLLLVPVLYLQFGFKQVLDQHKFGSIEVRKNREKEIYNTLNYIENHPLKTTNGYYLLENDSTNALCAILFHTDQHVIDYNEVVVEKLQKDGIEFKVIP